MIFDTSDLQYMGHCAQCGRQNGLRPDRHPDEPLFVRLTFTSTDGRVWTFNVCGASCAADWKAAHPEPTPDDMAWVTPDGRFTGATPLF